MDIVKNGEWKERGQEGILWLAINAKYSHTSLAVRYLRECVPGSEILELTINHQLLAALGEIYERRPRVLGIACYIWNIEMVKDLLRLLPAARYHHRLRRPGGLIRYGSVFQGVPDGRLCRARRGGGSCRAAH